jgi:hypothetical protein
MKEEINRQRKTRENKLKKLRNAEKSTDRNKIGKTGEI